jgi:hypothetical protein
MASSKQSKLHVENKLEGKGNHSRPIVLHEAENNPRARVLLDGHNRRMEQRKLKTATQSSALKIKHPELSYLHIHR